MNFVVENKIFLSTIYLVLHIYLYYVCKINVYQLLISFLVCICNVHLKDIIFTVDHGLATIRHPGLVFFFFKNTEFTGIYFIS